MYSEQFSPEFWNFKRQKLYKLADFFFSKSEKMSFRKRKSIILEEYSHSEENDFDAEVEDDNPLIEEEPEPDYEFVLKNWNLIQKEYAENLRNKILGGSRVLPVSQHLEDQSFSSPFQLWKDTYGLKFFV